MRSTPEQGPERENEWPTKRHLGRGQQVKEVSHRQENWALATPRLAQAQGITIQQTKNSWLAPKNLLNEERAFQALTARRKAHLGRVFGW